MADLILLPLLCIAVIHTRAFGYGCPAQCVCIQTEVMCHNTVINAAVVNSLPRNVEILNVKNCVQANGTIHSTEGLTHLKILDMRGAECNHLLHEIRSSAINSIQHDCGWTGGGGLTAGWPGDGGSTTGAMTLDWSVSGTEQWVGRSDGRTTGIEVGHNSTDESPPISMDLEQAWHMVMMAIG